MIDAHLLLSSAPLWPPRLLLAPIYHTRQAVQQTLSDVYCGGALAQRAPRGSREREGRPRQVIRESVMKSVNQFAGGRGLCSHCHPICGGCGLCSHCHAVIAVNLCNVAVDVISHLPSPVMRLPEQPTRRLRRSTTGSSSSRWWCLPRSTWRASGPVSNRRKRRIGSRQGCAWQAVCRQSLVGCMHAVVIQQTT